MSEDPQNHPERMAAPITADEYANLAAWFETGTLKSEDKMRYFRARDARFAHLIRRVGDGSRTEAELQEWLRMIMSQVMAVERLFGFERLSMMSVVYERIQKTFRRLVITRNPYPFVRRMVYNLCFDRMRAQGRQVAVVPGDEPMSEDGLTLFETVGGDRPVDDAARTIFFRESLARIVELIARHPNPKHGHYFALSISGLGPTEIAELCGVSTMTVNLAVERMGRLAVGDFRKRNPDALRDFPQPEYCEWHQHWLDGKSVKSIARESGTSRHAVHSAIEQVNSFLLRY